MKRPYRLDRCFQPHRRLFATKEPAAYDIGLAIVIAVLLAAATAHWWAS